MSFALGFYEIFSYAIPGFLYVLVVNGFLQLLKLPHIDLGETTGNFGFVVLMAILSYLAGHLADPLAYRWYLLLNRKDQAEKTVARLKANYPDLDIRFEADDRRALFSFIKHRNLSLAEYLDKFNAIGVMLQNLSLGIFTFALIQIAYIFTTGRFLQYGLGALLGLLFSFIAVKRSALFKSWYTQGIFEQALHYGTKVEAMFEGARPPEPTPPPPTTPARRPRTRSKASGTTTAKTSITKKKAT